MKKSITLCLLFMLMSLGAHALSEGRSWDFTKWSDATLANLAADATNWRGTEKADGSATENDGRGYWVIGLEKGKPFTANGEEIKELAGLLYNGSAANSLAIAFNIPSTSLGEYDGAQFLWLGGKNKKSFDIPNCQPGDVIEMEVESHKPAEGRGVQLLINGTKITIEEGTETPTVKTYCKWTIPADVTVDDNGVCAVTVDNTNGCHIYNIKINGGGGEIVEDAKNVLFVYGASEGYDLDSDFSWIALSSSSNFNAVAMKVTDVTSTTATSALAYDAVALAGNITTGEIELLAPIMLFVPIMTQGVADIADTNISLTESTTVTVAEAYREHAMFEGVAMEDGVISFDAPVAVVELDEEDLETAVIVGTTEGKPSIAMVAPGRNTLLQLPAAVSQSEVAMTLVPSIVSYLASTKKDPVATAKPVIKTTQKDGATTVEITAAKGATVFYTLDGTDPTFESAVYKAAFDVTADCTVKAFAVAPGYYDSEIVTAEATIASQSAAPSISVAQDGNKAVVTISGGEGTVYYNYSSSEKVAASAVYTEPLELTHHATVTAFCLAEGKLQSEAVQSDVVVEGYKYNKELAHFNPGDKAEYYDPYTEIYTNGLSTKVMYYFSWGKSGQTCYTEEVVGTKEVEDKDENGNVTGTHTENIYAVAEPETLVAEGHDWIIGSAGQVVNWSSDAPMEGEIANEGGRYPATVDDWGASSKGNITFGKITGEATAFVQTTAKYAAPFEVIAYVGNGNSSSQPKCQIQVSADGKNWTSIADCNIYPVRRCYKKTVALYEAGENVYVRLQNIAGSPQSAQIYDIYINGVGEYDGIESVTQNSYLKTQNCYNLAGQRVGADYKGIVIKNGKKVMVK